jgi:hypothetical protein
MKKTLIVGAAIVLATLVDVEYPVAVVDAQDRVSGLVAAAQQALGGEKLTAVQSLSAEGPFRRSMGQRDMEGLLTVVIVRPDKLRRSEEMGMAGMANGPTMERISALNGDQAWEDMQNRGGMGGGMRVMMRGPDGPGGGALTPEQIEQARLRRMRAELQRWTMALLLESPQPFTDAGVAESPEGKADILETRDEAGRPVRLFLDQETHLPLMLQYQEVRPRIAMRGPGGPGGRPGGGPPRERPSEEEMKQRMEELRREGPPKPSTMAMYFSDYREIDGVKLPHTMRISVDGQPNEEWAVEKFQVNPEVKASEFEKPK